MLVNEEVQQCFELFWKYFGTGIKITRKHSKGMVSGHKLLTIFISLNLPFRFLQSVMIGVKRDALGKKKFSLCEVSKKKWKKKSSYFLWERQ